MSARRKSLSFVVGLGVVAALFGVTAVGTTQSAIGASKVQPCKVVVAGGQSYRVTASNASCAFAQKWVAKLASKSVKSHAVRATLSGGPSGYTCFGGSAPSGSSVPGVASTVQTNGSCRKGLLASDTTPYFNWMNTKV